MQLKAKLEAQVFAKQDAEQTLQTRMRQWESERSDMQDKYKAMDDSWKAKVGAGQGRGAARKEGDGCWGGQEVVASPGLPQALALQAVHK